MKVNYYVASSLDGYIAKKDGDVSWLEDLELSMEDTGYNDFFSTVDALVMGRKTYEMIVSFGQWPYGDKPVWVCSGQNITAIDGCNLQSESAPEEVYKAATEIGTQHLWLVGGGSLASSFLECQLLSNISLSLMPIILGSGIKLFDGLTSSLKINKESEKIHESGMVQLDYVIKYS
ncbi:MAG: dihydrofolate reductase family protein [Gammaproteobacteria bacterium]|nr:dihydrofolate reductase family protein [Gammaproteobacteria bacterium]